MHDDLSEVITFFKVQSNNIINSGNLSTVWAYWDILFNTVSRFSGPACQLSMSSRKERKRGINGEKQPKIGVTIGNPKIFEFGIRTPNRPARFKSLYRLSYSGPQHL
jgi:hypothetical protein